MINFNEKPQELQGGKMKNNDDQRDVFEDTEDEYQPISKEQAKLNEKMLKEDEYYLKEPKKEKEKGEKRLKREYILVNKGLNGQKDEEIGRVWAYSDAQALLKGHRKGFNMSETTICIGTNRYYNPNTKKVEIKEE